MIRLANTKFQNYDNKEFKGKAKLIFADLPYGVTRLDYDKNPDPLYEFWDFCREYLAPDGIVICTAVFKFAIQLFATSPKGWFRYDLVWEKTQATGHLNAKRQPMRAHELVLVFSPSGKTTYVPQKTGGHPRKQSSAESRAKCHSGDVYGKQTHFSDYDSTERYPRSVMTFSSDKQTSYIHPNQKPLDLLKYLIKTYTNEGDLVIDPVAGSGTTGLAALSLSRDCLLIEQDEGYFKKMIERFKIHEGDKVEFVNIS